MAEFTPGSTIQTKEPTIEVTIGTSQPLPVGRHRFQLVVVDDSDNVSRPDEVVIIIADQSAPTAVIRAPGTVAFGNSFTLDGGASFDVGGGRIVRWDWTYVGMVG